MDLGTFSVSLSVENIEASLEFYNKLGFKVIDGGHTSTELPDTDDHKWRILQNGDAKIGLFQGAIPKNMLTFNPPDVRDVQRKLKDSGLALTVETADFGQGPAHIMLEDPDGNPILMDQH